MIVGITGGIGSGKSILSQILQTLGYFVFNSDLEAKNILQNNTEVKAKIIAKFGDDSFFEGKPNRAFIAEKVFTDKSNLDFLNNLIHPKVQDRFQEWIETHKDEKILFKEAAILIESGAYKKLDKLILVDAEEAIRIERVMKRDNVSREQVVDRLKNQMPAEEKKKYADFIVDNNGNQSLILQVMKILEELNETV